MEKLFGRAYETIGSTGSDFIIKTKGQVKIQWGNKFIDIVKDGKIVSDGGIDITKVPSENDIPKFDGIYFVEDSGAIYVVVDGTKVNIAGEVGTTYVSFAAPQNTSGSQKLRALENIGLIFDNTAEATLSELDYGIVYIKDLDKVYTINQGKLREFIFEVPNPYTKTFIIQKETDSTKGALVIRGEGEENSILLNNNSAIYEQGGAMVASGNNIYLNSGGKTIVDVSAYTTKVNNKLLCDNITSMNSSAFKLYVERGVSTLVVDNIIWRNKPADEASYVYPSRWLQKEAVISNISEVSSDEESEAPSYSLTFYQPHEFNVGDILCTYVTSSYETEDGTVEENIKVVLKVISNDEESSGVTVNIEALGISEEALAAFNLNLESLIKNKRVFYVASGDPITRVSKNNIDLLHINSVEEEEDINNVKTRIGSIQDLDVIKEGYNIKDLSGGNIGIYSDNLVTIGAKQAKSDLYAPTFKASPSGEFPKYDTGFNIPIDDDSKTVVTSEWVNNKTDKRLEEYVRKDEILSIIEQYIQPVDGTYNNPVAIITGTIKRASRTATLWYFVGGKKNKINNVSVKVDRGLMTIIVTPTSGHSVTILAVAATIGDSGAFNGDFNNTSMGGRSAGGNWCNAIPDPNQSNIIRIRNFSQGNSNNDSWQTPDWNHENCPLSVSLIVFGFIR